MNTAPVNTVTPTRLPHFSLRLIGTPDRRMVPTSGVILDPAAGAEAWILQGTHNLNPQHTPTAPRPRCEHRVLQLPPGALALPTILCSTILCSTIPPSGIGANT